MSSSTRKKLILKSVTVSLGCGSCRRSKLTGLFFNPKTNNRHRHRSSSSKEKTAAMYDDSTASPFLDKAWPPLGRVGEESVAVEKESDDPYWDFRQSMLQMVLENEIYSKEGLRELLNCFLQLNSPYHHGIIVRAFTDIWNWLFSGGGHGGVGSSKPPFAAGCASRDFYGI